MVQEGRRWATGERREQEGLEIMLTQEGGGTEGGAEKKQKGVDELGARS